MTRMIAKSSVIVALVKTIFAFLDSGLVPFWSEQRPEASWSFIERGMLASIFLESSCQNMSEECCEAMSSLHI